ncbi:PREDICTED: regulatory solute carrier protein family 1 member 1 isoform X1 [Condylura cristata]|uniref:regulatory solute carrier protein family 1 member 1 isoform X1 n=1 Tax=Condylura cristata TaxID=143302 RepID=UPI0003344A66|nr:PREDICTED: regulatory solute carrier protein family 1 member 1 isoform X1 [Condylura cristata]
MSSLPTSAGLNYPAHPSGRSPEFDDPASLAHSVSASVCPTTPSDPDSLEPKAQKTLQASAEFQTTTEKKAHLSLQDLSDCVFSGDSTAEYQSPATPLWNSSEEAIVADNQEVCPAERSTQALRSRLHTSQEASLPVTTTKVKKTQKFQGDTGWLPEYQSLSQVNSLQQSEEPGSDQHEIEQQNVPRDHEHPYGTEDLDVPGENQQNPPKNTDLEATVTGDRLPQNVELLGTEKNVLRFGCSNSETFMDVDAAEQPLAAVLNSAGGQKASVQNTGAATLTLDNPLMEVETAKSTSSSEILSNSISTQDLQLPQNNAEMSGANKECGNCSPSISLGGNSPSPAESADEPCSSVTAALKELHELLVTSSKPAAEGTSKDVICSSETVEEGQAGVQNLSERRTPDEHLTVTPNEQCSQASFHQAISFSVKAEKLTDASTGAGIEGVENSNFRGPGDGLLTDKEAVPKSRESLTESSTVTLTSARMSNQLHYTLGVEISPKLIAGEEDALSQSSEQAKSWSSSFMLVKDTGQGTENPVTGRPATREDICPEAAGPLVELEPPASRPASPAILPPLIVPAADVDRILRAGFTLQEALGALRRVGGNADLALLVLLAKNIVVPT